MRAALLLATLLSLTGSVRAEPEAWTQAFQGDVQAAFAARRCQPDGAAHAPIGFAEDIAEPSNRPTLRVTSAADEDPHRARPAPGTLRWALAEARRSGGALITFDPALSGAHIVLAAPLAVPSSTSLEGGCTGLRLDAEPAVTLINLRDVHDVAIRHLTFARTVYDPESKTSKDAISLAGRFDNILIEDNRFRRCGDGCIDIVHIAEGSAGRVTITRNLFVDHNKVLLFANNPCLRPDPEPGCDQPLTARPDALLRPRARVSVIENVFWGTSQRHPNIGAQVYVHAQNNLIAARHSHYADGRQSAVGGMGAFNGGFLLAQANLLLDLDADERPMRGLVTLDTEPDPYGRSRGFLRAERNRTLGAMRIEPNEPSRVPEPGYRKAVPEQPVLERDPITTARCLLTNRRPRAAADPCET